MKKQTAITPDTNSSASAKKVSRGKPLLEVTNVTKSFKVGKNLMHVLHDINIAIMPEEFIIILGPSGSGKSTLLNILLGLEPSTTGKVVMNGIDITDKKIDQISKIRYHNFGVIFQKADWVRSLDVLQNTSLPLAINKVRKKERLKRALEQLTKVGMDDHAAYMPTELSGGQQQKVSLARALINDPPIVVADEPTGNLDSVSADKVMNIFKDLNERLHKTVIMVTHNIDYVRYASRTIYVRDGTIVQGSEQLIV